MPFYIDTAEVFDKCFIGCTPETSNELNLFSGQLSTIYLFNQALDSVTVQALFNLGPSYKNQFRFENETVHLHLNAETRKLLYDGRLTQSIVLQSAISFYCNQHLSRIKRNILCIMLML